MLKIFGRPFCFYKKCYLCKKNSYLDKMKKLYLFLWFLGFGLSLCGQEIFSFQGENGKYGFVKRWATGSWYNFREIEREVIAEPKYDSCEYSFMSVYPKVKLNNKWWFVDKKGNEITPIKYDLCRDFSKGFVTVKLNDKWGYVDTNGKETILLGNYDDIGNPYKFDIFPEWGDKIIEKELSNVFIGNLIFIKLNGKFGLIDTNENIVISCKYDKMYDKTMDFSNGYCLVQIDDKLGMIDNKGNEIIPILYDEIDIDDENFVIVKLNDKEGVIDYNGKEVVSLKWDECIPWYNGTTKVKLNGKYGLIENFTEKEILPIKYNDIRWFANNNLFIVRLNDKYGFIDTTEKEIIPYQYTNIRIYRLTETSYFIGAELDDKWGIIDTNGKEILPIKYDALYFAHRIDLVAVRLNEKWGVVDYNGKEVIPIKFDNSFYFNEGENYASIESNNKYIYIDTTGKEIVSDKYEEYYPLNNYLTMGKFNEEWFLIRTITEEELISFKSHIDRCLHTDNTLGLVYNKEIIFVNSITGEKIAVVAFDDYWKLSDGYTAIKIGEKWGLINNMGEKIIPCKYKLLEIEDKLKEILNKK